MDTKYLIVFFKDKSKQVFIFDGKELSGGENFLLQKLLLPEELKEIEKYFIQHSIINTSYISAYFYDKNKLKIDKNKIIEIKNRELQGQNREIPNWDTIDSIDKIINF